MARHMRKPIAEILGELQSWLPNYSHWARPGEPMPYPELLFRILASLPGGEELADAGYEGFGLGWHEADQLGRVLIAIETRDDVAALVTGLLSEGHEDEGEAGEARKHRRPVRRRTRR